MKHLSGFVVFFALNLQCRAAVVEMSQNGVQTSSRLFNSNTIDGNEWPPKFCNGLDCPKYTVVNKTEKYEIRDYDLSNWVSTSQMNIAYDAATEEMFMRLFGYISGKNSKSEKIAMTAPVIIKAIPGQGPACENNFTMSFYIAPSVSDPPTPSDKQVFLSKLSKQRVYVKEFGGFANEKKYLEAARELIEELPASASVVEDYFYTAGYDAPFKLLNRHNEVWLISK